jgi:hypothetical protein
MMSVLALVLLNCAYVEYVGMIFNRYAKVLVEARVH